MRSKSGYEFNLAVVDDINALWHRGVINITRVLHIVNHHWKRKLLLCYVLGCVQAFLKCAVLPHVQVPPDVETVGGVRLRYVDQDKIHAALVFSGYVSKVADTSPERGSGAAAKDDDKRAQC